MEPLINNELTCENYETRQLNRTPHEELNSFMLHPVERFLPNSHLATYFAICIGGQTRRGREYKEERKGEGTKEYLGGRGWRTLGRRNEEWRREEEEEEEEAGFYRLARHIEAGERPHPMDRGLFMLDCS